MSEREIDVVIFGATSVTGRRVAAYLAERTAGTDLSWAAAGRDLGKLERVLADEGVRAPAVIAADVDDAAALRSMAARARVVVNLVGPYTRFGAPVIAACVAGGADYVDLSGELAFVRRMIDAHQRGAREAGVKVVQVCGFEALPPDLGVALAREAAAERYGEALSEVDLELAVTATPPGLPRASDFVSGGTMQSMAEVAADPDAARLADPSVLVDDPLTAKAVRERSPIGLMPRPGSRGAVLAPMSPTAFVNPAVIHRSAALAAAAAGEPPAPFRYREAVAIAGPSPTLVLRYAAAGAMAGMQASLAAATRLRPESRARVSAAMRKALPGSGFGPAADRLEDWRWRMDIVARTASGKEVEVAIDADGHPGYLATARMLGEAGLLLADAEAVPEGAGCLTPAIALGTAEVKRFERARLRFSVA